MGQAAPQEMQEDLQVKFSVLSKVQMPILEELDRLSRTLFDSISYDAQFIFIIQFRQISKKSHQMLNVCPKLIR